MATRSKEEFKKSLQEALDNVEHPKQSTFLIEDGFIDDRSRQMHEDLKVLSDAEWAEKYPEHAAEWLTDEEIKLVKPHLMYIMEQSIVYAEVGGFNRDGSLVESDLRINHPSETVWTQVVTLRSDVAPQGENAPKNDPDSSDPVIWAWEADEDDWFPINIRRVHHFFNMNLRKWYPNQHWILDKLTRWTAMIDYYEDADAIPEKFPSFQSEAHQLLKKKERVTVTLKPDMIPEEIDQEKQPDSPQEARYDPESVVKLWNVDAGEWIELKLKQIYNMDIDPAEKIPTPPEEADNYDPNEDYSLKPKNKKPINWIDIRDGITDTPIYDDE